MKYILLTESDKLDIIHMRKDGAKLREIAEYIGCTFSTVYYHLRKAKIAVKPLFSTEEDSKVWQETNCKLCKKRTLYNNRLKRYPKFRCVIQSNILGKNIGIEGVSLRARKATQQKCCPFLALRNTE